jgi:hemolysin activation/secretion protein
MPLNTDTLTYNIESHQYEITLSGIKNKFNVNLDKDLGSFKEAEVFIRQVSDRLYNWLYSYIRTEGVRVLEKRIADNFTPVAYGLPYREGLERALYAQFEYMINFDGDLNAQAEGNKDMLCSSEAKQILHYYGMAHKGAWADFIDPTEFRVGY